MNRLIEESKRVKEEEIRNRTKQQKLMIRETFEKIFGTTFHDTYFFIFKDGKICLRLIENLEWYLVPYFGERREITGNDGVWIPYCKLFLGWIDPDNKFVTAKSPIEKCSDLVFEIDKAKKEIRQIKNDKIEAVKLEIDTIIQKNSEESIKKHEYPIIEFIKKMTRI